MKTTLKIGMLAAVAALALAGCNNAIKPTEPAADSFAYNADQYYRGASDAPFTVKKIEKNNHGPTKTGEVRYHQIVVEFSHPVTKKAVMEGVKCYKLTNADNNYSMPRKTPANITDVRVDSMGTKAYLTVDTNDIDYLYVYVTASQMRAVNGALLNADKDDVWGERDDDDYAAFFDVPRASATPLVGFVKHAKETLPPNGEDLNRHLWYEEDAAKNVFEPLTVGYGPATSDSGYLAKTLELNTSIFKNRFLDGSTERAELDKFANEVLKYLKLEQYDWKKATWENVAVSFATNSTNDKWVSKIDVKPNRQLRARLIDADKIQLTLKRFGYPIKVHFQHNGPKIVVLKEALNTGYVSLQEGDNWPTNDATNDFTWKFASNMKTIEITLKPDNLGLVDNVFTANKWVQVKARNKDYLSNKKSFFAGFDPDTVTKDNFKCIIDKEGKRQLVIKDVTVVQSDVGNYPKAFDKIIISSEDELTGTELVYISHKVMTKSFTGSYLDGSTSKEYPVPRLCFAKTMTSKDPEELYGWRLIKKN